MKKLNKIQAGKLDFKYRGKSAFDTPIRAEFEKLEVGEALVFSLKEWNTYYKCLPMAAGGWGRYRKWKVSIKKLKVERTRNGVDVEYAVVRNS